jgi:hypothetical protein
MDIATSILSAAAAPLESVYVTKSVPDLQRSVPQPAVSTVSRIVPSIDAERAFT